MPRKLNPAILLMLFGIIAVLVYLFLSRPPPPVAEHYSFNEEIKSFPIEETSVTFTDWKIENSSYGNNDVVTIEYKVRNDGDSNLELTSFLLSEAPTLKYGNNYYSSATYYSDWRARSRWQLSYPYPYFPSYFSPNQTLNGYLKYEIIKGLQPTQLLFPDKNSPTTIIDFS